MTTPIPFFNRLGVRLAATILLLGFFAVPVISEMKRRAVERLVLQQAELQAATATIAIVDRVQDSLHSAEATVRYLARDLEDRDRSAAEIEPLLRNALASNPQITECGLGFEPGALAAQPADRLGRYIHRTRNQLTVKDSASADYQYWTRPWYSAAIAQGNLQWSEPFFDAGGAQTEVVRVSLPFYRQINGRRTVAGVVSAGFDLAWLGELARAYDFFDTGYVVIFSREGRLIAHPNSQYVFNETMDSLAQKFNLPELATIHERVLGKRQGSLAYFSGIFKKRVHENYKPAQVADWGVVVGHAEAEFLQPVNAIRWITTLALGVTLICLAASVLLVVQFRLRPLRALTTVSDEISQDNFTGQIPVSARDDEIGRLSRSFLVMRDVLKTNRALELQVRENAAALAATNEQLRGEVLSRRWNNQALEHQLRYHQLIIDSISESVLVLTKIMNISRINPATVHLTGFDSVQLVNTPLSRLVQLDAETSRVADPLAQALKEGRDIRNQPAMVRTRNGTPLAVQLSLFPLRDRDKVVGGVVILRAS